MRKVLTIFLVCILPTILFSFYFGSDDSGLPSDVLSNFSSSARAFSMANTFSAVRDDGNCVYFNPAGIGDMKVKEINFTYTDLFLSGSYSFINIAYPLREGNVFGLSRLGINVNNIQKTDEFGSILGNFNDSFSVYYITYARKLFPKFNCGINLKVIRQSIDTRSAMSYGVDLGINYITPFKHIKGGICFQNIITPKIKLNQNYDTYPFNIKIGISYPYIKKKGQIFIDADIQNVFPVKSLFLSNKSYLPVRWSVGTEYNIKPIFALRAGINYKEVTFGFGIKEERFNLDYGVGFHNLGVMHRIGLKYKWGMLLSEKEVLLNVKERKITIERYFVLSLKAYNEKNYKRARRLIKKTLDINPDNPEAKRLCDQIDSQLRKDTAKKNYIEGIELIFNGEKDKGIKKTETALKMYPEVSKEVEEKFFVEASRLIRNKQYKEAKEYLLKILIINPDNKDAESMLKKLLSVLKFVK